MYKLVALAVSLCFTVALSCTSPPVCIHPPPPVILKRSQCKIRMLYLSTACACFVYNHCGQLSDSEVQECVNMFGTHPALLWPNCNRIRLTRADYLGNRRLKFKKLLNYMIRAGAFCDRFSTSGRMQVQNVPVTAASRVSLPNVARHFSICTTKAGICNCFRTIRLIFTNNPSTNPLLTGTSCLRCKAVIATSHIPDFTLGVVRVFKGLCPPFPSPSATPFVTFVPSPSAMIIM